MGEKIKIEYYALSEKGRREKNEDAYIAEKINDLYVFAVADGLGGHISGEIASKIAIVELREAIKRYGKEGLTITFKRVNNTISFENKQKGANMGTTLIACIVEEDGKCKIANVGDSRAYIFNDDNIWRTKDHSLVQELVDKGVISEEEAFNHPKKNIVTQALGLEEKIRIDVYEKNLRDSVLLLCSDGLSDYVKDNEIAEIVKKYDPKKACKKLYKKALKEGSEDNITIIIAKPMGKK
ncbi:MAG TPA: serine/threonine-protein phosphatase [Thermoplasmata archaeon]|nr:serine/threonine-protein phosphatase [Thermoplasmata archaeon]